MKNYPGIIRRYATNVPKCGIIWTPKSYNKIYAKTGSSKVVIANIVGSKSLAKTI
jgi:hypothetical protein